MKHTFDQPLLTSEEQSRRLKNAFYLIAFLSFLLSFVIFTFRYRRMKAVYMFIVFATILYRAMTVNFTNSEADSQADGSNSQIGYYTPPISAYSQIGTFYNSSPTSAVSSMKTALLPMKLQTTKFITQPTKVSHSKHSRVTVLSDSGKSSKGIDVYHPFMTKNLKGSNAHRPMTKTVGIVGPVELQSVQVASTSTVPTSTAINQVSFGPYTHGLPNAASHATNSIATSTVPQVQKVSNSPAPFIGPVRIQDIYIPFEARTIRGCRSYDHIPEIPHIMHQSWKTMQLPTVSAD
jgi:hypothetical protein